MEYNLSAHDLRQNKMVWIFGSSLTFMKDLASLLDMDNETYRDITVRHHASGHPLWYRDPVTGKIVDKEMAQ